MIKRATNYLWNKENNEWTWLRICSAFGIVGFILIIGGGAGNNIISEIGALSIIISIVIAVLSILMYPIVD